MNIDDSIDTIFVSLNGLLKRGVLTQNDIFSNVNLLLSLNSEKYKSANDLITRLNWIKSMNMEYPKIPHLIFSPQNFLLKFKNLSIFLKNI